MEEGGSHDDRPWKMARLEGSREGSEAQQVGPSGAHPYGTEANILAGMKHANGQTQHTNGPPSPAYNYWGGEDGDAPHQLPYGTCLPAKDALAEENSCSPLRIIEEYWRPDPENDIHTNLDFLEASILAAVEQAKIEKAATVSLSPKHGVNNKSEPTDEYPAAATSGPGSGDAGNARSAGDAVESARFPVRQTDVGIPSASVALTTGSEENSPNREHKREAALVSSTLEGVANTGGVAVVEHDTSTAASPAKNKMEAATSAHGGAEGGTFPSSSAKLEDVQDLQPQPSLEERHIVVRPAQPMRDTLSCLLCKDLLKEAMTIPECGHTFCYQCIDAKILVGGRRNVCPICSTVLGPNPVEHGKLQYDFILDALVRKIFPRPDLDAALEVQRAAREEATRQAKDALNKRGKKPRDTSFVGWRIEDCVELALLPFEHSMAIAAAKKAVALQQLAQPYMLVPRRMTVAQLRKWVTHELDMPDSDVSLVLGKQILANTELLGNVRDKKWLSSRTQDQDICILHYGCLT